MAETMVVTVTTASRDPGSLPEVAPPFLFPSFTACSRALMSYVEDLDPLPLGGAASRMWPPLKRKTSFMGVLHPKNAAVYGTIVEKQACCVFMLCDSDITKATNALATTSTENARPPCVRPT